MSSEDFEELLTISNVTELASIKLILESKNIAYKILGETASGIFPYAQPAKLLVTKSKIEEAQKVLKRSIHGDTKNPTALSDLYNYKKGILVGLFLGGFLGYVGFVLLSSPEKKWATTWDNNGDGKTDVWYVYQGKLISEIKSDSNFDGKVDIWEFHNPPGTPVRIDSDFNHDGKIDHWEFFKGGISTEYYADNDLDGKKDEWGKIENGLIEERNWSFQNDEIADKKAKYKSGRKISELYDRNRDGKFDERYILDSFERVIRSEKLSG